MFKTQKKFINDIAYWDWHVRLKYEKNNIFSN